MSWERANPPLGLGFRVTSFDEKVSTNIKIYYLNTATGAMLEFSFPDLLTTRQISCVYMYLAYIFAHISDLQLQIL